MNEEKCMDATINLSRHVENDFWFNVFKSQKNESLTHSFFFESFGEQVCVSVRPKPCSARRYIPPVSLITMNAII